MRAKRLFVMVLAALWTVSCLASTGTEVRAEVAPNFSHESLNPGDPLAGGVLYLLDGEHRLRLSGSRSAEADVEWIDVAGDTIAAFDFPLSDGGPVALGGTEPLINDEVTAAGPGVALRVPGDPLLREILRATGAGSAAAV